MRTTALLALAGAISLVLGLSLAQAEPAQVDLDLRGGYPFYECVLQTNCAACISGLPHGGSTYCTNPGMLICGCVFTGQEQDDCAPYIVSCGRLMYCSDSEGCLEPCEDIGTCTMSHCSSSSPACPQYPPYQP